MDIRERFSIRVRFRKKPFPATLLAGLWQATLAIQGMAAESNSPASPEVTAAMQPYLGSYKLAGMVSIIADKTGKVHYQNLLGYSHVEASNPFFWKMV